MLEQKPLKCIDLDQCGHAYAYITGWPNALTYNVARVLQGTFPARANDVAVFIDIIGMPWTPVSYAGVARRSYRRAYWRR